jgi:hypothetical protein
MAPDAPMTRDEVDRALQDLGAAHDRVAAALYALDTHPAYEFLRTTALSGATKALWTVTRPQVDAAWARFGALHEVLDRARALRSSRSRPDRDDLAALTELLRDPTMALDADGMPVAADAATATDRISATVLSDRLELACRDVLTTLAGVADAVTRVVDGLTELTGKVGAARAGMAALGPVPALAAEVDRLDAGLAEVRGDALADPIGTGLRDNQVRALTTAVDATTGRLADLTQLQAALPARLAAVAGDLDTLVATEAAVGTANATAAMKIRDPHLPPTVDAEPALRRRLAELDECSRDERWPRLAEALPELAAAVAAALADARARHEFASGLLARRDELRGRLEAYRVMAVRRGRAEDEALSARYRQARSLLWTAPCDLPAATRAVAAYQHALSGGEAA